MTDRIAQFFNDYNGILAVVSILIGIIMFFYQQDREKKHKEKELHDMIHRFCNTIQTDITTIKNAISGDKYPKKKIENKNIE